MQRQGIVRGGGVRRHGGPRASAREELRIALERFPQAPSFETLERKPGEMDAMRLTWALLATAMAQNPDLLIADHAFADLTPTSIRTLVAALMTEAIIARRLRCR